MELNSKQMLIRVQYSGVNRADLSQKEGKYPAPEGHNPNLGLEVYGVVEKCGIDVIDFIVGDKVFALVNGGGYDNLCIVEEALAIKKPEFLNEEQCAAIPEAYMTAILNLVEIGQLQSGQSVLIHAGASGVGLAAIQLGKLLGAYIIATVRTSEKIAVCKNVGADEVWQGSSFVDGIKRDINLTLNPVGGNYIEYDLKILGLGGKLINIGLMAGSQSNINLNLLLRKNIQLIGSTLRNKSNEVKARLTNIIKQLILPAIESGKITIVIDKVFNIEDVESAHEYLKNNQNIGKVLLKH